MGKKEIEVVKPPPEIRSGTDLASIRQSWSEKSKAYPATQYTLDLSDVVFMDSAGFRLIFDYLSIFGEVIPPKDPHIIGMYDMWLDSKKGLKKNAR